MGIVLLTYNPDHWTAEQINDFDEKLKTLPFRRRWSCNTYNAGPGDHFFLILQGKSLQRGILAHGVVLSRPFSAEHWNIDKRNKGEKTRYIEIEFQEYLNPSRFRILTTERLNKRFPNQYWTPQSSGITVLGEYCNLLISEWENILNTKIEIDREVFYPHLSKHDVAYNSDSDTIVSKKLKKRERGSKKPEFDLDFEE